MLEKGNFSSRVKELRQKYELSQKDFAESIGISPMSISTYESGAKSPSIDTAAKICEKYKVSLDWLCGLSDIKSLPNKISAYSDLFMLLTYLCDIEYAKDPENESSTKPFIVPYQKDNATSFYIKGDGNVNAFFEQWYKIHELYLAKTIDEDIYNIWLEKELEKYDFPINGLPGFMN